MSMDLGILEIPVSPRPESLRSSVLKGLAATVLGTVLVASMAARVTQPDELGWAVFLSALFSALMAALAVTFSRQSLRPGVLRIERDHVRWRESQLGGEAALTYGEIRVAQKEGRGRDEKLVLKGREAAQILIPTAFLPETQNADTVLEAIREHIGLLTEGAQKLAGIAARQAVAERILKGRKTVAYSASALLVLTFVAQITTGALANPLHLWTFGANSYPLVKNGELFRLATANLLHGNLVHLFFNVIVLISLGAFLEPLFGAGRFLSVLLISALVGAAGSAFLGQHILSLGASTGLAGLIAAYAIVLWRWPDRLSSPPTRKTWLGIAFAFLWPALTFQNVDHIAHLTGFLAGLAVVLPEARKVDLIDLADRRRGLFRAIAALLVAIFLVAIGIAIQRANDPDRDRKLASIFLHDESLPSLLQNNLAWRTAIHPAVSPAELATALKGSQRAVENDPEEAGYRDTHATVLYRLGRWEEAVRLENEVVVADRSPFHLSQLARFEWALVQSRGPLLLGQPLKNLPRVQLAPGGSIRLEVDDPQLLSGAVLHLVLSNKKKASALLELTVGTSETSNALHYALPRDLALPRPDRVSLTLIDTRKTGQPVARTRWELQPIVPEAARLP